MKIPRRTVENGSVMKVGGHQGVTPDRELIF